MEMLLEIRDDYMQFLKQNNFDENKVQLIVQNTADQIQMPENFNNLELKLSSIHGKGLFAKNNFRRLDIIGPARIQSKRTPAGRYTNHSPYPNCFFYPSSDVVYADLYLVADKDIKAGEELTINYRQALSVNGYEIK